MFLKTPKQLLRSDKAKLLRNTCVEAVIHKSFTLPDELNDVKSLDNALSAIQHRWPDPDNNNAIDTEKPVFLFSAGWRSGSTLLQRLLCSSGELVMWGEPLGDTGLIPRLAASLTVLSDDWPPDSYIKHDLDLGSFSDHWIANIAPPISYLKSAHRALIDEWLARPAKDLHGTSQWGFKEVRLSIEHARYLKWLYPEARFVFIYRNLFDAYLSWRGNHWASAWPGYFSWSPIAYARHWKLLLSGYLEGWKEVDGYLVKYEDLITGNVNLKELAEHIGISNIDASVLDKRISAPSKVQNVKKKRRLTLLEKVILSFVARKVIKKAGYK